MLGYVRVNKPEMRIREYEAYKGLYCSLCKAMGKHFGVFSKMTLSYDITFLVLMRLSFSGKIPDFKGGRCPFNPTKKCNYCKNCDGELKYAAAVSMMMFYYKVKDNISDSSFFRRILMYLILPWAYSKNKKAKKLYPEIESMIAESMKRQAETEKKNTAVSDEAAHESAFALGEIMSYGFTENKDTIRSFGYGIGKWVYLCDAADDMEKDLKNRSFNVFNNAFSVKAYYDITKEIKAEIEHQLNMSCAFALESFDRIPDKTLAPICENILYEGTEAVMNNILKGKNENERPL